MRAAFLRLAIVSLLLISPKLFAEGATVPQHVAQLTAEQEHQVAALLRSGDWKKHSVWVGLDPAIQSTLRNMFVPRMGPGPGGVCNPGLGAVSGPVSVP